LSLCSAQYGERREITTERGEGVLLVLGYGKEENGPRPRPTRRKERGKGGEGGEGPGWADFGCGRKSCPRPFTFLNCFSFYFLRFFCSFLFPVFVSFLFLFLKYKNIFVQRKSR
jgi:hypothetical protein